MPDQRIQQQLPSWMWTAAVMILPLTGGFALGWEYARWFYDV